MLYKLGSEKIYYGKGSINELQYLDGPSKKAFIVMSGSILTDLGLTGQIVENLESAGFEIEMYDEVEPDPTFHSIYKGSLSMRRFEPDWVIGFGGGSAMDAAKMMWALYENPQLDTIEKLVAPDAIEKLREKAHLICIPTTAGTGSEVTRAAVIKDSKKDIKYPVKDTQLRLMADIAILDPDMISTMPKGLMAASGMDALTHGIESYVANNSNLISTMLSTEAIKLVSESLPELYMDKNIEDNREKLLLGSSLAGMAFSNSGLGICHSIAHAIGGKLGVPHGLANAIILPYTIDYLREKSSQVDQKYQEIESLLKVKDLRKYIDELNEKLNIPAKISLVLKEPVDIEGMVEELSEAAVNDVSTSVSPVKVDKKEFKNLIYKVF